MTLPIREMQADEAPLVTSLLMRCNEENLARFPADVAEGYRNELAGAAERARGAKGTTVLVAPGEKRLLGTVTLLADAGGDDHPWPPHGAVLRLLAVAPEARGTGLGGALVRECIRRARAAEVRFLGLHTAMVMEAARALYENLGFVRAPDLDFRPGAHYGAAGASSGDSWGLAYMLDLQIR